MEEQTQTTRGEQDETKISAYYRETDPAKRKSLLDEMESEDALTELRNILFEKRYKQNKKTGQYADGYLYAFMHILQTRYETEGLFGRNRKEMLKTLASFGKEEADKYGDAGNDVLHREIMNAAQRYFETCMSPTYRRKFFGTVMPDEAERNAHIRKDAYEMSFGLAKRMNLHEETDYLCRAVKEAYARFAPDAPPLSQDEAAVK